MKQKNSEMLIISNKGGFIFMANLKLVKSATALVLGASVLTSAVAVSGTDASAKTTYKVNKKGTLVNAKTNKTVKGYKSYKGKLYKNGKKLTGTYKSVFYKSGVKFTGTYNKKYYVKGKLFTGKTSKNVYYKKGVKFTGVTSYGYTYKDGKRVEGEYKGKVYKNGKLFTGVYKDVLYTKGVKETGLDLYKEKLYNEGVLNVGVALFQEKLYKDADLANGLVTYNNVEDLYKDGVVVPTKVESVSAVNANSITLTGTNLAKLTAADVTVEGNTVKSIVANADRTSATVTLNDQLTPDVTTKVTVKDSSFDLTYKIEAKTISVDEATYDDDTKNQFVAVKIDGKTVTAQELINAGYTLDFKAFDSKSALTAADITSDLLASTTTGELNTTLASAPFGPIPTEGKSAYVKVTLTKGSEVITSDLTKITIKNLNLAADSITSATLNNHGVNLTDEADGTVAYDDDFNQNSTTLVTGEKASFSSIKVKAGTEEERVATGYSVKSSNDAVVSVSNGVLTAEGPGTATVTITYGKATVTKTITVTNTARKATKVEVADTALTLTAADTVTTDIRLLDQYGDPIAVTASNLFIEQSDNTKAVASISGVTSDETGYATLQFVGQNAGIGTNTVTFRDAAVGGAKIGTTAVKATVTSNDDLAKYNLAVDSIISTGDVTAVETAAGLVAGTLTKADISTDATLDRLSDKYLKLDLSGVNSAGVKVSDQDNQTGDYVTTVNQSSAGVLATTPTVDANGFIVVEAGTTTGTATITVTNATNNKVVATYKVTVEEKGYNVTGATLKTPSAPTFASTLTYKDFLTYTAADQDPVVNGLTLTKDSAQPVRLDITSTVGNLYIDKNADGKYVANDGDIIVGTAVITTTGTIASNASNTPIADITAGVAVASGDNGTVLFKVIDNNNKVVATQAVKVDF